MRIAFNYITVLMMLISTCYSQNTPGVTILKGIYKLLNQKQNYCFNVSIKGFATKDATTPSYSSNCVTVKNNDGYYVKVIGKTTIITNTYSLLIDEQQRLIMYRGYNSKPEELQKQDPTAMLNMDTLLKTNNVKVTVLKDDENTSVLKIINAGSGISELKMYYDKKMNYFNRLEYFYDAENQKETGNAMVIINYKNIPGSTFNNSGLFNLKNYLSKNKTGWVPSQKYKNYKIVDQSNLKF